MSDVWVLGSAAWDVVYEVDRMPAAGGRAVARCLGRRAGGSTANVARALSSAGHSVHLVTQVGKDEPGTSLLDELASWGVRTEAVLRFHSCTPEAIIFIDENAERTIVVLAKDCAEPVPIPYPELAGADGVFVGGYQDFGPELPQFLRASPALVVTAVPPPTPPAASDDWFAHIVIGSSSEYPASWLADPYPELRRRVGAELQWVVVTQDRLGATAYGPGRTVHIPAHDAAITDTTGAGDCFAAGLLHGLLQGHDVAVAGLLGAHWAAAALPLPQSVPPRWAELGLGDPTGGWERSLADPPG